ncbi:hypothetical protein RRF57_000811 [Xylaria bambusicola]|uniref:Uncharacterized protein n=1 Tax=Xylaria bambusicola TaxID=326684 RepID=A0AAN7U435_9PEZI
MNDSYSNLNLLIILHTYHTQSITENVNVRAPALTLLFAVGLASAQYKNATIVVEKFLGNRYQNTTILFPPEFDYENPKILNQVSSLYQIGPEYTYFCFATRPDGTRYGDEWFGLGNPLHLSTDNLVVKMISCHLE